MDSRTSQGQCRPHYSRKKIQRHEEMAQWVTCILYKHKDLTSAPKPPHKNLDVSEEKGRRDGYVRGGKREGVGGEEEALRYRGEGDTDGDAMGSELGGDLHARITAWRFPEAARSSSSAPLLCCPRAPPKGTVAFGTAPRRTLRHALSGEFIGFPGSCSSSARGAAQGGPGARAAEFKSRSRAQGRG